MKSLAQLNRDYHELFYTTDEMLFPLLLSMVIGARLNAPSVWLFVIGGTSSGKSTALSVLYGIEYVTLVSDLTPNTFLSGMKVAGKETSLLKKLGNNFVVIMKDFTTMISKADEAKQQIIAQMREIYDGHISKETGNGTTVSWGSKNDPWKGMFLMAATEGIYKIQSDFADMGTRAINYVLPPQDERKSIMRGLTNTQNDAIAQVKLKELQADVAEFVTGMVAIAPTEFAPISEDMMVDITNMAMLAERARSSIDRDYRGEIQLAQSAGVGIRMAKQLMALAQFMEYANGGRMTETMRNTVFKVAADSMPKQRRLAIDMLARYKRVQHIALAMEINYPAPVVRKWIEDLNMFQMVDRQMDGGREFWVLRDEYRQTMIRYLGIKYEDVDLAADESVTGGVAMEETWEEANARLQAMTEFDMV